MRVSLVVLLALVVVLTGVGAFFGMARANSTGSGTSTATTTATHVVGRAAGAPLSPTQTYAPAAHRPVSPMQTTPDPASVVRTYFRAVNDQDFVVAWALGGRQHIAGNTYDAFMRSFNKTNRYEVTVNSVVGNKVAVELDELQTDETHHHYAGTFTVEDGVIAAADIHPK